MGSANTPSGGGCTYETSPHRTTIWSVAAQAKRAFNKTLVRVDGLLALHPVIHGTSGRPRRHVSDILRGALVLAVAALDSLVVDSVVEAVPSLARKGALGKTAGKWIREDPEAVLACLAEKDPHAALSALYKAQLGQVTFQRASAIEGVLRDVINCEPPWEQAASILSRQSGDSWATEDVTQELDHYVSRRNKIVHGGDLKTGGSSAAAEPIQLPYVERAAVVVQGIGDGISEVVDRRVRNA